MIQLRHGQPSLWHSGLAKDIEDLWELWMKEVDQLLDDAALSPSAPASAAKTITGDPETMAGRVRQVVRQTKARVFQGMTKYPHKIVSLFEPHNEIIRKGKTSKPNEFGKVVQVQEAENQIITHYEVFAERPEDSHLLVSAVEQHQQRFRRAPRMVAADAGFYSLKNEKIIEEMGVTRVAVPNRNSQSSERRKLQRTRWFRAGQRWRTGCEGRI